MLLRKSVFAFVGVLFWYSLTYANTPSPSPTKNKLFPSVVETTIKRGRHRSMGEINFLVPFKQHSDKIHFLNYMGKRSNIGGAELNVGYGVRAIRNNAVYGYYGFLDIRRTPSSNTFHQVTLGLEKLSQDLDYRINTYIPISGKQQMSNSARKKTIVETTGGALSVVSDYYEYPLGGIDFEIGKKFTTTGGEFGVWGGAYYFGHKAVQDVYGPMLRAELMQQLDTFATNARVKFGLQYQHDKVRGKNFISNLTFSMDLYDTPSTQQGDKNTRKRLSYLQQRMLDPVIRDVDIVTNRDKITETPKSRATGKELKKVVRVDKASDLYYATNNGEENTLIVVEQDITTTLEIKPKAGQILSSGTKNIVLVTDSGVVVNMQVGTGAEKKLSAKTNNQQVVLNPDGAVITGLIVQNKKADGTLVNADYFLPSKMSVSVEKGKSYNIFGKLKDYTFAKMCGSGATNCQNNISVDTKTGTFTIGQNADDLSRFSISATDKDGNTHQIMLATATPVAKQQAEQQKQNKLPNEEEYKGIRILYANNFKCSNDKGVWGQSSGANACGTSGKTKIEYVKQVIDRFLNSDNKYADDIIKALDKSGVTLTLFNTATDRDSSGALLSQITNQDLQANETFTSSGNTQKGLSADGITGRNATLEEIVHLIQVYGISNVRPDWQERLNEATEQALQDGKLRWKDDSGDGVGNSNPNEGGELPRRDLDDEYFADAVEAYFNMRGGDGYTKGTTLCVSGQSAYGNQCTGGNTAREDLRKNHKAMFDLVEEMFGTKSTFF